MVTTVYNLCMPNELTHLDENGRARMVDVGHKPDTERIAIARGEVHMLKATLDLIRAGQIKKGGRSAFRFAGGKRFRAGQREQVYGRV